MHPDQLNDETTYQRCYACGSRNPQGLQLRFRRSGDRILAEFTPGEQYQGFPGVLHGGVVATLLDETLSRTGALRGEWLMTGKLDIRYRRPAPIGSPLRVWGEIVLGRTGAVMAQGALELEDGTVVADARGTFVSLPPGVQAETMARFPEFAEYWKP
ncbi:MAG TPA: PaaI family thioesterase [Candidatus Limnocylindrales bacterium]|nr:PaaI family thioesterase [Candidatus Limnocylindrales bacterium]